MRPLLVILLVLLAVGALIFAVSTPGSDSGTGSTGVGPVSPRSTAQTDQPATRTTDGGPRQAAPAAVRDASTDPARVAEGVTGFANRLSGTVQDEKGAPVRGARVTLTRHGSTVITFVNEEIDRSGDITTETSASGAYSFTNIPPYSHYALIVAHPNFARAEEQASPVGPEGDIQEPPIVLRGGARLYGVVRNSLGDGVADAELILYGSFSGLGKNDDPDQLRARSDALGNYQFLNVPPGHRTLSVTAAGYGNATIGGLQLERADVERDVVLELAEMICGTVVGPGNVPIEGARVIAMSYASGPRQSRDEAVTGPDGRFCLEHVKPGQYTVAVAKPGYKPGREPRVEAGDTRLVFQLAPKSSISGVVMARDTGRPVTNFQVQLRVAYENTEATGKLGPALSMQNPRGEFLLDDVSEGIFVVEATADGYAPTLSERIRVGSSQEVVGITIQLALGGTITGQIVDSEGKPVVGAVIETRDTTWTDDYFTQVVLGDQFPTNASTKQARSDAEGYFQISALTPETYQIRVKTDRFTELVKADLRVVEQGTLNVGRLQLEAGGTITGTVVGADGQVVPGAQIQLRPDGVSTGLSMRTGKADAQGVFVLRNVKPGNYKISALAAGGGADIFGGLANQSRSERAVVVTGGREQRVELKLGG